MKHIELYRKAARYVGVKFEIVGACRSKQGWTSVSVLVLMHAFYGYFAANIETGEVFEWLLSGQGPGAVGDPTGWRVGPGGDLEALWLENLG